MRKASSVAVVLTLIAFAPLQAQDQDAPRAARTIRTANPESMQPTRLSTRPLLQFGSIDGREAEAFAGSSALYAAKTARSSSRTRVTRWRSSTN